MKTTSAVARTEFEAFYAEAEPRLQRALAARFGPDTGREAALDALIHGWRNWERVSGMQNPIGYLYRVGLSQARPPSLSPVFVEPIAWAEPWVEPNLFLGLKTLSDIQRTAVILHHSMSWTYGEIGEVLEVSVSTVRNHIDRGMSKLRQVLGVEADA